jgi:glyoxylase-like metal-dependent hydrolase (beta-lactamase superfamily II)
MARGPRKHLAALTLALFGSASTWSVQAQILVGRTASPPDIVGEWVLEGSEDRGAVGGLQPNPHDYLGIPFNDAGRMRSDTTAESIWGTAEYQCRPHSAPHQWRGLGGARILSELDPLTRNVRAYHFQFWRSLDRPVFMDGRPHPPAWAPHTWSGFSTGRWEGNTLVIRTTHLKDGFLRRGGAQTSDMLTMTEYLTRHGDMLTVVQVTDDPVYLDEPMVLSTIYLYDPESRVNLELCNAGTFAESGGTNPHFVPHLLPGQDLLVNEWLVNEPWVPFDAARGGAKTLYPEYRRVLDGSTTPERLSVPASAPEATARAKIDAQSPRDGQVRVLPVQGNIYMVIADGRNLAVSVGADGMMLVNTGTAEIGEQLKAALAELARRTAEPARNDCFGLNCPNVPSGFTSPYTNTVIASPAPPRPLRYILNTNAAPHNVGGNALLAPEGMGRDGGARIIAHENALIAMSGPTDDRWSTDFEAWPTESFYSDIYKMTSYFNGDPVIAYSTPATTDGDIVVFFRQSEVIVAGDIFSTVEYPRFDIARGGSVQGVIDGLNDILDLAVAEYRSQGGTWVIPGRGRLSDTADVASYRNIVQIIRDRIQAMVDDGMTLTDVLAARPTFDFDARYGSDSGDWTTAMFVEAVYRSLGN